MSHITTSFWWVRHAPVAHGGRIYGQTDLSCDCSETALFTGLAEKLPRSAMWVTSNLRRTHETAAAIVRAGLPGPQPIPGPEAVMMPELAEQDFGEWQGLTYEELQESRAGDFHRFWHAPARETPPAGESFIAVIERVSRAIHRLVETLFRRRHHRRRAWRHDPRRAGVGARPPPRSRSRLHDRELLAHPHRPHRRPGHGPRLAGRQSQPAVTLTRCAGGNEWLATTLDKEVDPIVGWVQAPTV